MLVECTSHPSAARESFGHPHHLPCSLVIVERAQLLISLSVVLLAPSSKSQSDLYRASSEQALVRCDDLV